MTSAEPFTRIKIRVAAALFNGEEIALIHRAKDGQDQYTLPGGNVEPGEPVHQALARELDEELGLDLTDAMGVPHLTPPADQGGLEVVRGDQVSNRHRARLRRSEWSSPLPRPRR
ncbi:NUDIX hydrolase [Streptomyces sp. NPDC001817]|uniref:NUDIX hydrolase n=1 Tax=Streptomyces sp. NPDC001817 TaxID=3154398 RepID=UPI003325689A